MRRYLRAFLAFAVQPNQNAMEENENIINVEVTEPSLPPPPAPENQCMDEGAINESLPETQTLENENTGDEVACQEYYCDEKPKVQRQAERQSVVDMKLIALQLRDEISGAHARVMREIAQAANDQLAAIVNPPARPPTCQFHQKTGQVRMPRALPESEYCSSDCEEYLTVESCEDVSFPDIEREIRPSTSDCGQKNAKLKKPPAQKAPKAPRAPKRKGPWIRTSTGDHAINPVKCPPCARKKKKDKCIGGPPCKECFSKGRITVESCQEWGEGWKSGERGARIVLPEAEF